MATAQRIVLSYPTDLSDWGVDNLEESSFAAYLRKVNDSATEGDIWEEFLDVGCCGDTRDLDLRVEAVEGGDVIGEDTEFSFEAREEADGGGGWNVQSAAGPAE